MQCRECLVRTYDLRGTRGGVRRGERGRNQIPARRGDLGCGPARGTVRRLPPGAGGVRAGSADRWRGAQDYCPLAPVRTSSRGIRSGAAAVTRRFTALLAAVVLAGCQEKLTSPADCPALCPGGQP